MSKKKTNGVYYTPEYIAKFIINHLESTIKLSDITNILEPSCGDGVFIKSLIQNNILNNAKQINLFLVEKDKKELEKAVDLIKDKNSKFTLSIHNTDYLDFHFKSLEKFDLIIGNPPYIKRKYLSEKQVKKCINIQSLINENINSIKNIWISFVISAISKLDDYGCFCFVLPGEILQVKYAQDLRNTLIEEFEKVEIFHFDKLIFELVEQDVIILFAYKKSKEKGLFHYCIEDSIKGINIKSKIKINMNKYSVKSEKWTGHILIEDELSKIHSLGSKFKKISYYCDSVTGIVTAANDYFIINKDNEEKHNLKKFVQPIIRKSYVVPRCINFTYKDYQEIVSKNLPSKLVCFSDNISKLSKVEKEYLQIGIDDKINERFKCQKRKPWYKINSLWKSEGIFFKRSHIYPKIIYNNANVLVTDSGYRITMKENYDIQSLIFCFYNSLTLIFCELKGRAYGGGVLELTPNEFKDLPIPYNEISETYFKELDRMFREKLSIETILKFTDSIILESNFGFDKRTILELQSTYNKLISSRMRNSKDK